MTSTDGVELTNTINTGLPWKMVAKGSRSSTKRNKKPIARVATFGVGAVVKGEAGAGAGAESASESEKLGVAVLGQHFAEKVEHVPIKKRRFIVRSPSPSNRSSSKREHRAQINHAMHVSRLNPNLIDGRTSEDFSEKPDCNNLDFSGIEILADVACSSDIDFDISTARDDLLVEESSRQQNPSPLSIHVDGDCSSAGTVAVSQEDIVPESRDQAGKDKNEIVISQRNSVDVLDHASVDEHRDEHSRVASGMMVNQNNNIAFFDDSSAGNLKRNAEADEGEKLAPMENTVGVPKESTADKQTEKSMYAECLKDDRLHWDLNLSMDAWGQPCDAEDNAQVTESVGPKETKLINSSKDNVDGVISPEVCMNISSPFGSKAEAAAKNTKESQSDYDSQFEDGELREPYPCWEENEGDAGEVEQVDYGSEPENERFYHLNEGNEREVDDVDNGVLADTVAGPINSDAGDASRLRETNEGNDVEKHVVLCLNDSFVKGSSPSRGFSLKPFKELPSQDAIQRRRSDNYEESNEKEAGLEKFMGRDRSGMHLRGRSPGRAHFGGWDSKRRLSPIYKGTSYGFGRPRPKSIVEGRGLLNSFDQAPSGPDNHVRRPFSGGVYRGRFRRFPDGGNRDFRCIDRGFPGDANEYPGRMHHRTGCNRRERSNSPVFRRLNYPQPYRKSRSRSRSRSPISWNNRNRSPVFRVDDRMERVRLPFQKRFPAEHEMGFMSPPRSRMSPPRNSRFFEGRSGGDTGENHNNFRARKSPGRMFRPGGGQRFENGPSMRRVNSENHFRAMMRHRRFDGTGSNNGGGGGSRGCKYEGGGEEEKGGNRYEMVNRHRRSDNINNTEDGDNIRRFRFNGEQQSVVVASNNNNGS